MGHYLAAKVGIKQNRVRVYTRDAAKWKEEVIAVDNNVIIAEGIIDKCSSSAKEALHEAELVLITWPSNYLAERLHEIEPYLTGDMMIGFIPGYGGKEFICKDLTRKGCILFGTKRVLSSTKAIDRGSSVECIDNRPDIQIAAVKSSYTDRCCKIMEDLFKKPCVPLKNYLTVSLTPSNPILHTSRIYSLFKDYHNGHIYNEHYRFYSKWSDSASEALLDMDNELQTFCNSLVELDLSGVIPLTKHYEISDSSSEQERVSNMTAKIRSLKFIKDYAPMVREGSGYKPAFDSRYFKEDFPYGLAVIKSFCEIGLINTPMIDRLLKWYSKLMKLTFYIDDHFNGSDLSTLPLPQNAGIEKKEDLVSFYSA